MKQKTTGTEQETMTATTTTSETFENGEDFFAEATARFRSGSSDEGTEAEEQEEFGAAAKKRFNREAS